MAIRKGDRVRNKIGGQPMEVRAVGDSLAICEWHDGRAVRQEVFQLDELEPAATGQQAQQPQPTPPPVS